jgi:hypothetical protein
MSSWRTPRHPEFAADGKTGWRLFNSVTEALKEGSYMDLPRRTQALHGLLDLDCGLTGPRSDCTAVVRAEPALVQAV